jgi:hypothetical protein
MEPAVRHGKVTLLSSAPWGQKSLHVVRIGSAASPARPVETSARASFMLGKAGDACTSERLG